MRTVNILWADDDWMKSSNNRSDMDKWLTMLEDELSTTQITPKITIKDSTLIADAFVRNNFHLLILDYNFENQSEVDPICSDGLSLLDTLKTAFSAKKLPPVIFFSQWRNEVLSMLAKESLTEVHACFLKDRHGFDDLKKFIKSFFGTNDLSFIVMADLHFGYLREKGGTNSGYFLETLYKTVGEIKRERKIDAFFICGDFAWKNQETDLREAYAGVVGITRRLELNVEKQLFICPGNHDVHFSEHGHSWIHFENFVRTLFPGLKESTKRFPYMNSGLGGTPLFDKQHTLFSIVKNDDLGIIVVGLNSNAIGKEKFEVNGIIDDAQWEALDKTLNDYSSYPKNFLRIALMHHPLFSSPGGIYPDESSLQEQGTTIHRLAKCGIQLVFHGHAHFSGVQSHRFALLNRPGDTQNYSNKEYSEILTVACPSLIAEPSTSSPQRQFLIIKLEPIDQRTNTRAFSLFTKVFAPDSTTWVNGQAIGNGVFRIECNN